MGEFDRAERPPPTGPSLIPEGLKECIGNGFFSCDIATGGGKVSTHFIRLPSAPMEIQ